MGLKCHFTGEKTEAKREETDYLKVTRWVRTRTRVKNPFRLRANEKHHPPEAG